MSKQPPDEQGNRVRPGFSRARQPRAQGAGHVLLARGLHALDAKAQAAANRALRIARGRLAPRPSAALRQALSWAIRSSAKRPRHGRGNGVRAAGGHTQRVSVKARVGPVKSKSPAKAMREHLTYMARDSAARDGATGQLFNGAGELDTAAIDAFAERAVVPHQFRFIVSPERGGDLDLERFTRELVRSMERDLGTRLDDAAAVHHDPDQPHLHIVVNGRDARGGDLVISRGCSPPRS